MPGMGMPGTGLVAGQMGRGFHYISVRAVFPVREQILNLVDATNFSEQIAAANLQIPRLPDRASDEAGKR